MAENALTMPAATEQRSPESTLLDHVERVTHNRATRFAVYLHLSRLRPHNRKSYHIRVAARTFDSLINSVDAQLYTLSSGDIVLMCKDARVDDVDYVIDKVRSLFPTDPVAASSDGLDDEAFSSWYDLETNYEEFLAVAGKLAKQADAVAPKSEDASAGRGVASNIAGQSLDPFSLAKLDDSLNRAQVRNLIRQQPSVVIGADGTEKILFQENFISIAELQRRLAPGFNLLSNIWLFQHLTQTIDRRILAALGREDLGAREEHISINLNISTIRSKDFERFDGAIGENAAKVVIELQQIDVFSDLPVYAEVRDWLRERGYRVLLDGLNPMSLRFFNPGQLDADYVKVGWGDEFSDAAALGEETEIADLVQGIGPEKFILARTDAEQAVRWALMLSIRRFQGRFIDTLMEKQIAKDGKIPTDA